MTVSMIFSRKNAGKWVACKGEQPVASAKNLRDLLKKVERRKDKADIRYTLVPRHPYIAVGPMQLSWV
jgi:hypothetical protein